MVGLSSFLLITQGRIPVPIPAQPQPGLLSLGGERVGTGAGTVELRIEVVLTAPSSHEGTKTPNLGQLKEIMRVKCSRTAGPIVHALKKHFTMNMQTITVRTCKPTRIYSSEINPHVDTGCPELAEGPGAASGNQGQSRAELWS